MKSVLRAATQPSLIGSGLAMLAAGIIIWIFNTASSPLAPVFVIMGAVLIAGGLTTRYWRRSDEKAGRTYL